MTPGRRARRWTMAAALAALGGGWAQAQPLFAVRTLRLDDGAAMAVLLRGPVVPPARYRVTVVPGSGCGGLGPVADRYFAGLLHAEVTVLHKPGVDPAAGLAAVCAPAWVRGDSLGRWQAQARAALREEAARRAAPASPAPHPPLPHWLVGISEGGELLPGLAAAVPDLAGLMLLSAPGLDPEEAGALQAERGGHGAAWRALMAAARDPRRADASILQGRSLRYWRELQAWPVLQPLQAGDWPLLQAWGDRDAAVPPEAYRRFVQRLRASPRAAPWCSHRRPGADHGLQPAAPAGGDGDSDGDGVQWLWGRMETWARLRAAGAGGPDALAAACEGAFAGHPPSAAGPPDPVR